MLVLKAVPGAGDRRGDGLLYLQFDRFNVLIRLKTLREVSGAGMITLSGTNTGLILKRGNSMLAVTP